MPAKNQRQDARRDANEPDIVMALEKEGYKVHRIGDPGDLLIWNPDSRHWIVLEVKMPDGRLTPKQKEYREKNPDIEIPIVLNGEQAVQEVFMR